MDPIVFPLHQSLTRPQLLAGCDRELYLISALVAVYVVGPLGFLALRPMVGVLGIAAFFLIQFGLARMAKKDPLARQVFLRSMQYKDYYPARADIAVPDKTAYRRW